MKTKINFFLTIMLVASVSMSFISCGGDDSNEKSGGNSDNSMVQNLMSHKWYCTSTDYDAYSYGGATYTQTWTVYFINEHQGVMHWTAVDRDSSLGTSRNEDDFEFEYYINGNTISLYGGSNFTFTYYGNYLMEGDDVFEAKVLTSSDYSYISNYTNGSGENDNDDNITENTILNNVSCSISNDFSYTNGNCKWYIDVNIHTTLESIYKGHDIRYGIYYGTYSALADNIAEWNLYSESVSVIMQKMGVGANGVVYAPSSNKTDIPIYYSSTNSGEKASSEEVDLLKSAKASVYVIAFVTIDGVEYVIDSDVRSIFNNR